MKPFLFLSFFISAGVILFTGCEDDPEKDETPPAIQLTLDAPDGQVSEPVILKPLISDKSGIEKVVFIIDNDTVFTDQSGPFEYYWNVGYWADGKQHFIQVIAWDKFNNLGKSNVVVVYIPVSAKVAVQPLEPLDGKIFPQNSTVQLVWRKIPEAISYKIEVSDHADFSTVIQSSEISDTTLQLSGLLPVKYYWRVKCKLVFGQEIEWSDSRIFILESPVWQKHIGRQYADWANAIREVEDGSILIAGPSANGTLDTSGTDILVYKLDFNGNILWSRVVDFDFNDFGNAIEVTLNGDYIVFGGRSSKSSDGYSMVALRLDKNGNLIWKKDLIQNNENSWGLSILRMPSEDIFLISGLYSTYTAVLKMDGNGTVSGPVFSDKTLGVTSGSYVVNGEKGNYCVMSAFSVWGFGPNGQNLWKYSSENYTVMFNSGVYLPNSSEFAFLAADSARMFIRILSAGGKFKRDLSLNNNGFGICLTEKKNSTDIIVGGISEGKSAIWTYTAQGKFLSEETGNTGGIINIQHCSGVGYLISGFSEYYFTDPNSDFLVQKSGNSLTLKQSKAVPGQKLTLPLFSGKVRKRPDLGFFKPGTLSFNRHTK